MKLINRDLYLNQLINRKENGLIKIITVLKGVVKVIFFLRFFTIIFLNVELKKKI